MVNEKERQVVVWATAVPTFRDEVMDPGVSAEEWKYQGEYIFILDFDESAEKVKRVVEFLDSKGTERLRESMKRATSNLGKTGEVF